MAASTITTGTLAHINGSPFSTTANGTPNAPYSLAAWPPPLPAPAAAVTTKFLYAGIPASQKGGVITRLLGRQLVGTVTGGILMMPINSDHSLGTAQMFATGSDDYDPIAVTPSPGNFLYAIDLTTNLLVPFTIDTSKGTLTVIAQGSMMVGPDPFNVVVDPQSKFVFVANCNCVTALAPGSVQVFSIKADGTLTAVGTFVPGGAASVQPIGLAISPDSKFLFISSLDNKVYVESITNGVLTDLGNAALPAGSAPVAIAISTDGSYVYTGNAGTHEISFFVNCAEPNSTTMTFCMTVVGPLGIPSMNSVTPFSGTVGTILIDPTNPAPTSSTPSTAASGFLYVTDFDHGIVQSFAITSTNACVGVMNCIPGSVTASGAAANTGGVNPVGLAIAH
jgi:DNA-binding beta-propeller fold protein YncE